LAILRALRALEATAGQAILQNHALVFMLHGLCKRWKQPVGFTEALRVRCLLFLDVCQNAGLEVVATMCDMDANSVTVSRP
jgi:hypothetical protein